MSVRGWRGGLEGCMVWRGLRARRLGRGKGKSWGDETKGLRGRMYALYPLICLWYYENDSDMVTSAK